MAARRRGAAPAGHARPHGRKGAVGAVPRDHLPCHPFTIASPGGDDGSSPPVLAAECPAVFPYLLRLRPAFGRPTRVWADLLASARRWRRWSAAAPGRLPVLAYRLLVRFRWSRRATPPPSWWRSCSLRVAEPASGEAWRRSSRASQETPAPSLLVLTFGSSMMSVACDRMIHPSPGTTPPPLAGRFISTTVAWRLTVVLGSDAILPNVLLLSAIG